MMSCRRFVFGGFLLCGSIFYMHFTFHMMSMG